MCSQLTILKHSLDDQALPVSQKFFRNFPLFVTTEQKFIVFFSFFFFFFGGQGGPDWCNIPARHSYCAFHGLQREKNRQ